MQNLVCSEAPNFKTTAVMPKGDINEKFQLNDDRGKYIPVSYTHLTLPTKA